ncbi:MAG: hypothetical protein PHH58_16320 [Rhodoferax sp.]|nr:hypothetical protein [Rhodoferax sp.]
MNLTLSLQGRKLCLGWLFGGICMAAAVAADLAPTRHFKTAQLGGEAASSAVQSIANWAVDSNNNGNLPFVILDKQQAKVFVFHANGKLRGAAPALVGLAVGDHSVPGIGDRKLEAIRPDERTTPAGRFVAALDHNIKGHEILWVDYDTAISLHPVVPGTTEERRTQRLATPTPLDNRISFGCINVPSDFFKNVVSTAFAGTNGIVYVLPETVPAKTFFGAYDVDSSTPNVDGVKATPKHERRRSLGASTCNPCSPDSLNTGSWPGMTAKE